MHSDSVPPCKREARGDLPLDALEDNPSILPFAKRHKEGRRGLPNNFLNMH